MYQEQDTSEAARCSIGSAEVQGPPAEGREDAAPVSPAPGTSRRAALAASALLGPVAALTCTGVTSAPAAAAVVLGTRAPTLPLNIKGTIVGRHHNLFRSFNLTGSTGVGLITVAQARYLVTMNTGDRHDTVQIFNADTGSLHYRASTPARADGNFVHDGKGTLYFSSGKALMSLSVPRRTIRRFGTVPKGVTTLYDLQIDYKGRLWAGTYPAGVAVCFSAATGKEITRTPRIGAGNDYVRALSISSDRKTLWAGTGTADPDLFRISVDVPSKPVRVTIPGRGLQAFVLRTAVRGRKVFVWHDNTAGAEVVSVYDVLSRVWSKSPAPISGRSISTIDASGYAYINAQGVLMRIRPNAAEMKAAAVATLPNKYTVHTGLAGSMVYLVAGGSSMLSAARVSTRGTKSPGVNYQVVLTAMVTQSMVVDPATNTAYAGGYQGDGLCATNLATGAFAHSLSASGIAQIEGMIVHGGALYVGSYGSAVIVKHSTASGVRHAGAFKRLARLGDSHHQSRPFAWAVSSSHVVFGTVPEYGHRGGALGTIEKATGKVRVYNKIIPGLSIVGLTASGNTVYGSTSCRAGYGIADHSGSAVVFAADARTGAVKWKKTLAGTKELYGPVLLGGKLYVGTLDSVVELRVSDGAPLRTFVLGSRGGRPGWQNVELTRIPGTARLAHLSGGTLRVLEPGTRRVATVLTKAHRHISFDSAGAMWVTVGNDIVKLRLDRTG